MNKKYFDHILVFSDGACSGNPGPGGWGAIIVTPDGTVREMGNGLPSTTNNRMEIIGVAAALESLEKDDRPIAVHTDSVYVIRGITQWIWGWRKRGWKTAAGDDVANKDLWEWLSEVVGKRKKAGDISWHYVRGHSDIPGNERCDEIAVEYSMKRKPELYHGPLLNYGVAIHDIPEDTSLPEMKERKEKVKAHSYLSVVDGVVRRHAIWPDCERVVKGRSGAKFKKATSADDELEILAAWGYGPEDIKS